MVQESILWSPPPQELALSSDDVHVWCASLEQPASRVEQLRQILSAEELSRADRFYFEQHKKRFIVGRGLLRTILGRYLGIEPSRVQFSYGAHGKPALEAIPGESTLQFNLSHSQDIALYGVTCDRLIGVDIEYIRPMSDAEQIVERFFAATENAVFRALPTTQKQEAFFNCWTRKEAYLKACGDGLARSLNHIEVSFIPGEPARLLSIEGSPSSATSWCLRDLAPASGYVAAIAVEGHDWQMNCWQWSE